MLVDDDTELAPMVVELLRREGMQAVHVETGNKGLAELAQAPPDAPVARARRRRLCRRWWKVRPGKLNFIRVLLTH